MGESSSLKCLSKDIQKLPDDHPSCLGLGRYSASNEVTLAWPSFLAYASRGRL